MLLHAYLDRVGVGQIFATVTGSPALRYDDLAVLSTLTLGFALGTDTVEGVKHLRRAEAGAAVGLDTIPELRALWPPLCRTSRPGRRRDQPLYANFGITDTSA